MNKSIIFSFPGNKKFVHALARKLQIEEGILTFKKFPDGESYLRIDSTVKNKVTILFCTLNNPDNKILSLIFIAETIKTLGAKRIILISPYLPYMRQDKRFKTGEAISAQLLAKLISNFADSLVTIDPHLHRIQHLSDIYSIPVLTLHASNEIAKWIQKHIENPFLIGPDDESRQWVFGIARRLKSPYVICKKNRLSSHEVKIHIPAISGRDHSLIILDDILSTGSTMAAILKKLSSEGRSAICLAVHPLFKKTTKNNLLASGASEIISCNTISNSTNKINIIDLLAANWKKIMENQ